MFGRFPSVRLKMAEHALRDGRLDDAYETVTAGDLRDHRRAQKVLCKLATQYLERARRHASDGCYAEALIDLGKAGAAGIRLDEIAALRQEVLATLRRVQQHDHDREKTLEAAAVKFDAGSLVGGHRLLDRLETGSDIQRLRQEAADREISVRRMIEQTQRMFDAGRHGAAAESLKKIKRLYPRVEGLMEIEAALCDAVIARTSTLIDEGAVDRAAGELAVLGELGRTLPARLELETILALTTEVADALHEHRISQAVTGLRRLAHLAPRAAWVSSALEHVERARQAVDAVFAGPLGAVSTNGDAGLIAAKRPPEAAGVRKPLSTERNWISDETAPLETLPKRLLVSVDAGGSYLLIRSSRVTIGRSGVTSTADVPLVADLSDRHAEIARVGEDYFLFARRPVVVGGHRVTQKLLEDGDRIQLGRRGRITFRLPSRMSASAVLDLGDGMRSLHDVRRVVLLDRHVLIGPHKRCHLTARSSELVLFERSARLWLREADSHGGAAAGAPARAVAIGQYVAEGGIGLSIRPWNNR